MLYLDEILLHVSRGVRWDSDHVVILNDELRAIAEEMVRGDFLDRVHIGLDYFDASINRVAAWVIGTRAMLKALLLALLEPTAKLRELESSGDFTARLALLEELKTLPFGAVWDYYCLKQGVPVGTAWLDASKVRADVRVATTVISLTGSNKHECKSLSRRLLPLAGRTGLRQLLRPLPRRAAMVLGNLLAGRRVLQLDHRAVDPRLR